jgi:hypothetical protein
MANIQAQRFGVREICNVVFKAKAPMKIGNTTFQKGQPVLYMDTAKTSTLEGAATTVYATGGRGNTRLIAWEGEKTLTFTVEDALLSPISFAMLSGAGLLGGESTENLVHVHTTSYAVVEKDTDGAVIDLSDALATNEYICPDAPIFIMKSAADGAIYGGVLEAEDLVGATKVLTLTSTAAATVDNGDTVFVDYYVVKTEKQVTELQIDMEHFGGYFYVEADTLYRFQEDGQDYPAIITLPNVKIQSNFTFSMAATGDPSTFTFTMDAFPGYTYFNKTRKVLCVIQVVDAAGEIADIQSVMRHGDGVKITSEDDAIGMKDSLPKDFVDNSDMASTAAPYVKPANSKDDTE